MDNQTLLLPERIEAFIASMDSAATLVEITQALANCLAQTGFDYFAYWLLWPPGGARRPLCITNYPERWADHYRREDYGSHDYVGRFAVNSTVPFIWSTVLEQQKLSQRQKLIFHEAAEAGLRAGGTVPIHGPANAKATFSVSNDMPEPEFARFFSQRRHEIHLMATYAHEKIIGLGLHKPLDESIRLTPREIEVLTWASKGKSRWEASIILGIGEDTVKTHLENIRAKLGASNTNHAIAIAVLNGLLLP